MQLNQVIDGLQGPRAEQAARWVAVLLGVWVLYRSALLVWALVPAPELPAPPPPTVAADRPAAAARPDVRRVAVWHLFGSAPQAAAAVGSTAPIDAPETRLNLVLRGVLSSDDPEEARAIIAEPNGTEKYFRVGSSLPGGAELKEIHADRIILLRAGRPETLRLPRDAMEGAGAAGDVDDDEAGAPDAGALLSGYREQVAANPQALLDLARPVPYSDGNGFAGFRLFPGNKPGLFAQLGLRPGDVLKEVNGVVLDSPVRGAEAMQLLRDSKQVALRIDRGGQDISLAVDIP